MESLRDTFGRTFSYLRLSVTDACNFRCSYCLPNGYHKTPGEAPVLTTDEIRRLARAFARMGFWKFRITGGEPLLRPDIVEIARIVAGEKGVRRVALSTNGYRLAELARPLSDAGVTHLNVSVDSLDRETFHKITGQDRLREVLDGISAALETGTSVKVNAVLMKGENDEALESFAAWVKDKPIAVRFIELMRTGGNSALFEKHFVSGSVLAEKLATWGWSLRKREESDGPANEFTHPDYRGSLGVITPYAKDFCASCNRLRVSSRGDLKLCLFGDGGYSLRALLQSDDQEAELQATVRRLIGAKEISHFLQEGRYGSTTHFAGIGG